MRYGFAFALLSALFATVTARAGNASFSSDDAFWVSYWGQPRVILNGSEEGAFYHNRNEYDQCLNPDALDDNARWLKEHPNVRFYVDGYASARGEMIYNLMLSKRRADWGPTIS
jgi:outer membrane protein OmpA-like peptidoglycan-associated protein